MSGASPAATGPLLVTVAHGSRVAAGNAVAVALTSLVAERWDGPVAGAYVELCEPEFGPGTTAANPPGAGPAVVVPLLFSVGLHVCHDLTERLGPDAVLAPPLGPDPVIAGVQLERLRAAGARPGQPVTMVAAGSRHPGAADDLEAARAHLEAAWGAPVRLASISGAGRRPSEVVQPGDAVSPYLLAPGYFTRSLAEQSRAAGATVVADALGPDPALADLVVARALGPTGRSSCRAVGRCAGPGACAALGFA